MSCDCSKKCECQSNGSFSFGLILGLIIGALIAVIIYKNNKEKVFEDLKRKLESFFDVFKNPPSPQLPKTKKIKKIKKTKKKIIVPTKKEVVIPANLVATTTPKIVTKKPSKMFKK